MPLVDRGLIGQFTYIWPSPRTMASWLEKNWKPLIKGSLNHFFHGRGFFALMFELKEDQALVFRSKQHFFLGIRGIYLNKWTTDFGVENDMPFAIPV